MKIASIVGARPQFIKLAPLSKILRENKFKEIIVHTGQHYDENMNDLFFKELEIPEPDYNLGIGSGNHGEQTGKMLIEIEKVLLKEKPDLVIVFGDTNSTLAGALAAVKLHIPVVHIEAGLRSFNKQMPEEINRLLTDHSSTLLLSPSKKAVENLKREGFTNIVNEGDIIPLRFPLSILNLANANASNPVVINVGDIMYDVLLFAIETASKKSTILADLKLTEKKYNILTLHRAENTDNPAKLQELIDFVAAASQGLQAVFPVHPRTKRALQEHIKTIPDNIRMIEPLGYFDMLWLVKNSAFVMTDSGGLQKEAYWLKVPCITLRDKTEWVETVESGWNILYKDYKFLYTPQTSLNELYGDGRAAERVLKIITAMLRR
jgi:UDP-N-acetylglucosamine 2-epimerase